MAWSHAQGVVAGNVVSGGSVASQAATFANPLTNPSVIVASVFWGSNNASGLTGVTDTAGNTYTSYISGADGTNGGSINILVAINSHTTASNVVTAAFSPNQSFTAIIIDEYIGGGVSQGRDTFVGTTGSAASPGPYTTANIPIPTANGDLLVGAWTNTTAAANANAVTANSPWSIATQLNSATLGNIATEWFSQGTAAVVQGSWSWTASGTVGYESMITSIKAAAGGGGGSAGFQEMPPFFQG